MTEKKFNCLSNLKPIQLLSETDSTLLCIVSDTKTNQEYIAKMYKTQFKNDEDRNSFMKEVISFSKLKNPAISQLSGFILSFDRYQLPMVLTKLRKKGSLDQILDKQYSGNPVQEFTSKKKYLLLMSIIHGIQYLHSKGIFNSNLKPSNILLDDEYMPRLSNVYLTQFSNSIESSDFFYTAPEILLKQPNKEKADTYSFSLILYELLANKRPYDTSANFHQFLNDIKNFQRPDLKQIRDLKIRNFLKRCWSNDPSQRPTFDDILEEIIKDNYLKEFCIQKEEVGSFIINFRVKEGDAIYEDDEVKNDSSKEYRKVIIKDSKYKNPASVKLAAQNGDVQAMFEYALLLQKGEAIPPNKEESFQYYKKAADRGHPLAMHNLAIIYFNGTGVDKNIKLAVHYFKKSADAGETLAMMSYAYMLHDGIGVQVDLKKSARYYKMAADHGNVKGMLNYAIMLQNGEGVAANIREANRYFKMSADGGDAESMASYGYHLKSGNGIEKNIKEAMRYFRLAAEKGSTRGMSGIGVLLKGDPDDVDHVIPVNKKEAARYIKMAADKGDVEASFNYGYISEIGEGTPIDYNSALKYYKFAADKGNTNAMYNYGAIRYDCTDKSFICIPEAIEYFQKAANQGNLHAIYQIGMMTLNGIHFKQDKHMGIKYIKNAAEKGNREAMAKYASMLYEGVDVEKNKKKAARFYKIAADAGDVNSMLNYGLMLYNGDGIPENKKESEHYFKMADERGNVTVALD